MKLFWQKGIQSTAKQLVKWMFTFDWKDRPDIFIIIKHEGFLNKELTMTAASILNADTCTEYNLRRRNKIIKTIDYNYDERIKQA